MDLSIARSRHHIFRRDLSRSPPVKHISYTPASTLTSDSPTQSLLRQSLFQFQSIKTVLTRLQQYDNQIQKLNQHFGIQLQNFNKLSQQPYDENNVLNQIVYYSRSIESYQQVLNNYSMISIACPHDTKEVGLRSDLNIEDIKTKLKNIILKQQSIRDTLLQNSIKQPNPNSLTSSNHILEYQQLKHTLTSNRTLKTQLILIIFKQHQKYHKQNIQKLQRHKNILFQLENVFQSLKLMEINQKQISILIENMKQYFILLHSKIDQPLEIQRQKRQYQNILTTKQEELIKNKKIFYKNVSNSYLKGYTEQLDQFTIKHNQFEKSFEQYRVNAGVFDSIFQHRRKIQQKLVKKGKTTQDIQQIRNIYRSLLDLQTNDQLSYFKYNLISQHSQTLQKLNIQIQSFSKIDNYLLSTKIKQFQKIVQSGLPHMSLNLSQLQICKSQLQQILQTPNLKQQQQVLCRNYIKQLQVSFKLIEVFDGIKKQSYKIVESSLYGIEEQNKLGKFLTYILVQYLDNMGGYTMFGALHQMFYEYVRDLVILNEIENQYKVIKNIYHKKLQSAYMYIAEEEKETEENMIKSEEIQLIFPILKSIRNLSSLDTNLKTYLYKHLYKIYYNYIYKIIQLRNKDYSSEDHILSIQNNPFLFNSFDILSSCEYLRINYHFYSKSFFQILEKTIQNICSVWNQFTLKQKVIQLIKLYFYQMILEQQRLQKQVEYVPYKILLDYLVKYLNLDTEIRIISLVQEKLTFKSPVFFEIIKLYHQKSSLKHNINQTNPISSLIRRFTLQLQNTLPIKVSLGLNFEYLINQLKVVESGNDLKEICGFDKVLRVIKRGLLYYYLRNILNYRIGSLIEEGKVEVVMIKKEGKYEVDLKELEGEVGQLIREYEQWAGDMMRKLRGERVEQKNYPYSFQREVFTKLR